MRSAESVQPPQGGDFENDDEDALSQRSSSLQADSFCSLNSWDSFRSESSYIGPPDIEERRDNFWYRKVFANSSLKDAPKTKNILSSGIPKPQKFLSQFVRVIRKSAPKPVDGQTEKNSLPNVPISHPPFSDGTEVSLPAIYGGELPRFSEALAPITIKQMLGRLPRKPSKTSEKADSSGTSSTTSNSSGFSRGGDPSANRVENVSNPASSGSNAALVPGNRFSAVVNAKLNGSSLSAAYEALPGFKDVPNSERHSLFIKKLNLCCVVLDFTDPTKNLNEKDIKRQTLLELVDYITSASGKFTEATMQEITKMVSANLFRALATAPRENKVLDSFDFEDDGPLMDPALELTKKEDPAWGLTKKEDPAWAHLQIVYEFFLWFVASPETDAKLAIRYIDHFFVLRLLDLFDSEDPGEREYLKIILHRIYGKFMVHRPFIRKAINNIFYQFIFETGKHNGIAELLEILGSIINGFTLPLREEYKLFLVRALIPLHKPKGIPMYYQQLSYCITLFMEKDCKLADTVIRGLLKYWPVTNSSKEVMFLQELEEILEATQPAEFQRCMVPLFRQIAKCLNSSHFLVAERALFLWNNDHIENLIKQNRKVILPIIFPALERNARQHWNQAVQSLTLCVRKLFSDNDPELFEERMLKFQEDEAKEKEMTEKREAIWKRLEEIAVSKATSNEAVLVPRAVGRLGS